MRLFTTEQHKQILGDFEDNNTAAAAYEALSGNNISRQVVAYWRTIFIENDGKLANADRALKGKRVLRKPSLPAKSRPDFVPEVAMSILVIPDQHAPYEHPDFLRFLGAVRDTFNPDLVVNLGDELDFHALSFHDSDPNLDSAGAELERGKRFLWKLHKMFPKMLVCDSNHGSMVFRRAKAHGIPVQAIKSYKEVIFPNKGGQEWHWAENWCVQTPMGEVMFKHQSSNILTDAAHNSCNLVVGHSHGNFSIEYSASSSHLYYGMYCGCGIDKDALAFAYGKHSLRKPILGCGVILSGRPFLIPMELNRDGEWIGCL